GSEVPDVLLDDRVDVDVRQRVETHVGEVEVDVVHGSELGCCAQRLLLLAQPRLGIVRVLRRRAVRDDDDAHLVAALRVDRDRPAHPEHLVVGMCREHEDAAHPSFAPTTSPSALVWISSSSRPPSPQATTGRSSCTSTIVPAGASSASSTGRAPQTITFSSPRNVNAPGYGRVWARTQS